jgi:hypothetical protein
MAICRYNGVVFRREMRGTLWYVAAADNINIEK